MDISNEKILVLDFGGQYSQLIARRVRELNVYCEVKSYKTDLSEIKKSEYKGIIFSGGPKSVYAPDAPSYSSDIFDLNIPILGICYGAQLIAHILGGKVVEAPTSEYGNTSISFSRDTELTRELSPISTCWMSHTDYIVEPPKDFIVTGCSSTCPVACMENHAKKIFAVQFHPEVEHTVQGNEILKAFLYEICECKGDWQISGFVNSCIEQLRNQIGDKKVLCALSGGVDSSVVASILSKAIGNQLTCIFVDHGFLRKDEGDSIEQIFREKFDMNIVRVNAQQRFIDRLIAISDPETKRKIIGEEFIKVFEEEAAKLGQVDFLGQGTIYPDIIESGTDKASVIKSHHNVGGLPENIKFTGIIEPLRNLFKDEVRKVGKELGLPDILVNRQPFPGPGLAIRIIGEITKNKLDILREADSIMREEIINSNLEVKPDQYFAVLTNIKSVGVMGDNRTYEYTIALRAVNTSDFMTADFARIPYDILERISVRIVNEVKNINRVVYDITSKPPSTIEWE